jgi:hypothetical protein
MSVDVAQNVTAGAVAIPLLMQILILHVTNHLQLLHESIQSSGGAVQRTLHVTQPSLST